MATALALRRLKGYICKRMWITYVKGCGFLTIAAALVSDVTNDTLIINLTNIHI